MSSSLVPSEEEKEKRRKKQTKRMEKILARAWQLDETSQAFQDDHHHHSKIRPSGDSTSSSVVLCLTAIGLKLDKDGYRLGRHGWEEFAQDLGGVYNRHIARRTKRAELAKQHLETVKELLGARDQSLVEIAAKHVPDESSSAGAGSAGANENSKVAAQALTHNSNTVADNTNSSKKRRRSNSKQHHFAEETAAVTTQSTSGISTTTNTNTPMSTSNSQKKFKKQHHKNPNKELAEREDRAMELLKTFVEERISSNSGNGSSSNINSKSLLEGFSARVTKKRGGNKYDTNYFNGNRRRFRSMMEVGRFLKLVQDGGGSGGGGGGISGSRASSGKVQRRASSQILAEKKRLRKELERLRKAHLKSTKALDDFNVEKTNNSNNNNNSSTFGHHSHEDLILGDDDDNDLVQQQEHEQQPSSSSSSARSRSKTTTVITRATAASARIPDMDGFPGVPSHCVADVLMSWDFLCTFERSLALSPVSLDDFACALTYQPPPQQTVMGDDVTSPPVYLAEAHLGLLKLLLQDPYSDDWWWSTLESEEGEAAAATINSSNNNNTTNTDVGTVVEGVVAAAADDDQVMCSDECDNGVKNSTTTINKPVVKFDVSALLNQDEDPLITASWLRALENDIGGLTNNTRNMVVKEEAVVKQAIKTALKVVANKWVHAYLRKALKHSKTSGKRFLQQAVVFLVSLVRQGRPDLLQDPPPLSRTSSSVAVVKPEDVNSAKQRASEEGSKLMQQISSLAPTVTTEDAVSDFEYEDDDESDADSDDDDEEEGEGKLPATSQHASERHASVIPPRPSPSFADMLLPPTKPDQNSEYINSCTWPHILGATAHRILHRKKRLLNETDDFMRSSRELPSLLVPERREREKLTASRILTECAAAENVVDNNNVVSPTDQAIEHLCAGGDYLQLSTVERLCLLRLLIEAAYDTSRLYSVVDGNIKQRTNATKALEVEQRRAKREVKEKAAADEALARDQLAIEAKEKFFDEKRDEIRKLNDKNKELSEDLIESLTEEDILDFDEDFKADYDALPKPESFNKTEVKNMVARIQEEAAFDTDSLRVLTLDELLDREARELEEMEGELLGMGGEVALLDSSLDRETVRSIERLQRDLYKAKELGVKLPEMREKALDQLRDAMADGTIKVLRSAITAAKKAKLSGPDDETGGVWAVDLMRDAALELENAKQNKRVLDAQKDLVAKMNKCFIRSEPSGHDRFGNRFWQFDQDEEGHVWVEVECVISGEDNATTEEKPPLGFLNVVKENASVACGAPDMEDDIMGRDEEDPDAFRLFSRREYHSAGVCPRLTKNIWGCHATEESIRAVIKILDSRWIREKELKKLLKESVEQRAANDEKHEIVKEERTGATEEEQHADNVDAAEVEVTSFRESDDEALLKSALEKARERSRNSTNATAEDSALELIEKLTTAIGARVRVCQVLDPSKDPPVARYESGTVTGWKYRREETEAEHTMDEEEVFEPNKVIENVPVWKVASDRGHTFWLTAPELFQSISRYDKFSNGKGYFENASAFFSYRNTLGRYCGRAADASFASSPLVIARSMVKREAELYAKLKIRSYDNNWGGKSGARALWTNSMKDFAFDFNTVKQGLLTLETAFFELTGAFADYADVTFDDIPDVQNLLSDPKARNDIELETIEKVPGLWNSPTSRAVFLQLVKDCKTTGILALALDQLCRNTFKYLQTHKLLKAGGASSYSAYVSEQPHSSLYEEEVMATTQRRTRGMNAWQKKQVSYEEFF